MATSSAKENRGAAFVEHLAHGREIDSGFARASDAVEKHATKCFGGDAFGNLPQRFFLGRVEFKGEGFGLHFEAGDVEFGRLLLNLN